jgi:hypothetical protein
MFKETQIRHHSMTMGCWNVRNRVVEIAGKYTDNRAKTHIKAGDNGANKWQVAGILRLQDAMGANSALDL